MLWAALNSPRVRHPLFRHIVRQSDTDALNHLTSVITTIIWVFLCPLACALPLAGLCVFLALPGAQLAMKVSGALSREHANGTYPLLGVMPLGRMGVSWMICTVFRDGRPFELDALLTRDELALIVFFLVIVSLVFGISGLAAIFLCCLVFLLAYIDFAHSLVLGALVGIWASDTTNRLDARIQALTAYVAFQAAIYLLIVLVGLLLLPLVMGNLMPALVFRVLLLVIALGLLLLALRETLLLCLWRLIRRQLNDDFGEIAGASYVDLQALERT
ncbi:MAG: hypothetical protein HXY40_06325 [Chloroflexi bacterium]|nr:hypothetical protein [Chloroflexota bacterium]